MDYFIVMKVSLEQENLIRHVYKARQWTCDIKALYDGSNKELIQYCKEMFPNDRPPDMQTTVPATSLTTVSTATLTTVINNKEPIVVDKEVKPDLRLIETQENYGDKLNETGEQIRHDSNKTESENEINSLLKPISDHVQQLFSKPKQDSIHSIISAVHTTELFPIPAKSEIQLLSQTLPSNAISPTPAKLCKSLVTLSSRPSSDNSESPVIKTSLRTPSDSCKTLVGMLQKPVGPKKSRTKKAKFDEQTKDNGENICAFNVARDSLITLNKTRTRSRGKTKDVAIKQHKEIGETKTDNKAKDDDNENGNNKMELFGLDSSSASEGEDNKDEIQGSLDDTEMELKPGKDFKKMIEALQSHSNDTYVVYDSELSDAVRTIKVEKDDDTPASCDYDINNTRSSEISTENLNDNDAKTAKSAKSSLPMLEDEKQKQLIISMKDSAVFWKMCLKGRIVRWNISKTNDFCELKLSKNSTRSNPELEVSGPSIPTCLFRPKDFGASASQVSAMKSEAQSDFTDSNKNLNKKAIPFPIGKGSPGIGRDGSLQYNFKCQFCDLYYTTERYQKKHMYRMHRQYMPKFMCGQCNAQFSHYGKLREHKLEMNHKTTVGGSRYQCEQCGQIFEKKTAYEYHTKYTHTDRPIDFCAECNKTFKTHCTYLSHMRYTHGPKVPTVCDVCGNLYESERKMLSHRLRHNKDNWKYTCEHCGKAFITKESRKLHQFVHTGEKPYKCTICSFACNVPPNLQKHMKIHTK